jgi:DNA-binding IclR family transcriptional regulator
VTDNMAEDSGNAGDRYFVPALERGLRLLGEFNSGTRAISAPEFSRRLGLPRSTVFRLLSTLEGMGFLERVGNEYRLGMAVLRLGFEYLASLELTQLGQPILERLCADTRYAANLVVRDERSIVYVAKVSPPTPFASAVRVGTRLPAHSTVMGRILLQEFTLPALRALYPENRLEEFSKNTPRTVLELFNLAQIDRERGYALGEGFFEERISSIAAPVRDHTGHTVAACGITIPADHIDPQQVDPLIQRVCAAAAELSALLNYQPGRATGTVIQLPHGR